MVCCFAILCGDPGWTREETEVLRFALMKYGIGNWQTIIEERVLPGKTNAQLVCQTQRLLGQQSLIGSYCFAAGVFLESAPMSFAHLAPQSLTN
jgi:hypothetical protein